MIEHFFLLFHTNKSFDIYKIIWLWNITLNRLLRSTSGGKAESDCHLCDEGRYCAGTNNTSPTGDCAAGYYCKRGNRMSTPNNGTNGGPCYQGHYCPQKTSTPKPCDIGWYKNLLIPWCSSDSVNSRINPLGGFFGFLNWNIFSIN